MGEKQSKDAQSEQANNSFDEFKQSARDEALSAAEKALEAAQLALVAAEKKLAEVQKTYQPTEQKEDEVRFQPEQTSCRYGASVDSSIEEQVGTRADTQAGRQAEMHESVQTDNQAGAHERSQVRACTGNSSNERASDLQSCSQTGTPNEQTTQQYAGAEQQVFSSAVYEPNSQSASNYTNPANRAGQDNWQSQQYYEQPSQQRAQPHYAAPYVSSKDHVAAGLLAIFFGAFGVHKFYLGYSTQGFIMLAISILAGIFTIGLAVGVIWAIAIIEGILYLSKSQSEFEQIYVYGKREWF